MSRTVHAQLDLTLSTDEFSALPIVVKLVGRGSVLTALSLARELDWPVDRAAVALDGLKVRGLIPLDGVLGEEDTDVPLLSEAEIRERAELERNKRPCLTD